MGEKTGIRWTDSSWNPWWGCSQISEGCANCYAQTQAERFGFQCWGPETRRALSASHWHQPLTWQKVAERTGVRRRVFPSMCDIFEDRPELDDARNSFWHLVSETPALDWLILTKRPENIARLAPPAGIQRNVWLGTTAENQRAADQRLPFLLAERATGHFVSAEPMLGPVNLAQLAASMGRYPLRWVICGCESGHRARPMDLDWVRSLRDECAQTGTPFFFKQAIVEGRLVSMPELDGRVWAQVPTDFAMVAP